MPQGDLHALRHTARGVLEGFEAKRRSRSDFSHNPLVPGSTPGRPTNPSNESCIGFDGLSGRAVTTAVSRAAAAPRCPSGR